MSFGNSCHGPSYMYPFYQPLFRPKMYMQKDTKFQELIRLQQASGLSVRDFCSNLYVPSSQLPSFDETTQSLTIGWDDMMMMVQECRRQQDGIKNEGRGGCFIFRQDIVCLILKMRILIKYYLIPLNGICNINVIYTDCS
jgi:hypothetical protein